MNVEVVVRSVSLGAMRVCLGLDHNGNKADLPVRNPALSDHGLGKFAHRRGVAAKHRQLKTVLMIEMDMHGRDLQFMVRMMSVCQPLRQFTCVVIEYIGQRRDALAGHAIGVEPALRSVFTPLISTDLTTHLEEGTQVGSAHP